MGKIMHRIINKTWAGEYKLRPINSIHSYNTRHSTNSNYYVKNTDLNSTRKALTVAGPYAWENVPTELKMLPLGLFVKNYKMYLVNQYDK